MIINDLYTILAHRKMQKIENTLEKHPIAAKTQRNGTHEQASNTNSTQTAEHIYSTITWTHHNHPQRVRYTSLHDTTELRVEWTHVNIKKTAGKRRKRATCRICKKRRGY